MAIKTFNSLTIIVFFCFTMGSCEKNEKQSTFALRDTITMHVGDFWENNEEQISISMDSVTEDNRCPLIADCIWEGNAIVKFNFGLANNHINIYLNTASDMRTDTVIDIYKIELLELSPMREDFSVIEQELYSVKIVVTPLKLRI